MKNQKNARELLAGIRKMPKPDLSSVQRPNIRSLVQGLGEPVKEEPAKIGAAEATGLTGATQIHVEKPKRRLFYDLTTAQRATAAIQRLPDPEESFHCIMGGDYHGFDLVLAVRELALAPVDVLHIATLGFNRHNMSHLCTMLDAGDIGRVHLLCSDYFSDADFDTYGFARLELGRRGHRCASARNHAKVLLFAIGERRYVVESSANLRSCNNLEQFTLTQSAPLYDFHRAWIERVLAHATT